MTYQINSRSLFTLILLISSQLFMACQSTADKLTPPGKLVPVQGYNIHVQDMGAPSKVTVVFESGMSGWSVDWAYVQPEIAKKMRAISYDRPGSGFSEENKNLRDAEHVAGELNELLRNIGVDQKIILVGHSLGGLFAQYYGRRYPDQVAGVVLVDSVHPMQTRLFSEEAKSKFERSFTRLTAVAAFFAPTRLPRLFNQPASIITPKLPENMRPMAQEISFAPKSYRTLAGEMKQNQESQLQVEAAGAWPKIPVTVLSAGKFHDYPPGFEGQDMKGYWDGRQKALKDEYLATQIVSAESGHYIQLEQPQVVIDAIVRMAESLDQVESQSSQVKNIDSQKADAGKSKKN